MVTDLRWLRTENTFPYRNLAIEEYLTTHTLPGEVILFLWQNHHTVVIGKNQDAWKECKVNLLEEGGGYLVRRLSGGGAVYHDDHNLNFTFCVQKQDYDVDRQLSVILSALQSLGIRGEKTGRNDITVDGRKVSGNAFYSTGPYCYHHGTLLVKVDPEKMGRYLNVDKRKLASKGVDSVKARVTGLETTAPGLTVDALCQALVEAFRREYGLPARQIPDPGAKEALSPGNGKSQLDDTLSGTRDPEAIPEEELEALTAKFASWDFRLGRPIPFTYQLEDRFEWGGISLGFSVSKGVIRRLEVHSDAMDDRLAVVLQEALTGRRYDVEEMTKAVCSLALPTDFISAEEVRNIKQDIADLIKENL